MKLSEVITHLVDFNNHIEGTQYLVINKFDAPHIRVISYLLNSNHRRDNIIFKSDMINLEFLSCYLNLNMYLFKKSGNIRRNAFGYNLDHLTPEYIGNIEIPEFLSPPRERDIQDKLASYYDNLIELPSSEIHDLFDENYKILLDHEYPIIKCCNGSDLFKITNFTLFFKNIIKGNLDENPKKYIDNLKPELIMTEYLIYYLHYSDELFCCDNYNHHEFDINEFHGKCFNFKLPSLNDQLRIIQNILPNHVRILELRKEIKLSKSILRELILCANKVTNISIPVSF